MQGALVIKAEDVNGGDFLNEFGDSGVVEAKILWPETGVPIKTFVMGVTTLEASVKSPMHRHNIEEAYYILEGEGYVQVEDGEGGWEQLPFAPEDTVFIKENVKHRAVAGDNARLRFVYVAGHILEPYRDEWGETFPDEG